VRAQIRNASLSRLLDDWIAARGARALPSRHDLPPEKLRELLGDVTLFDVLGPRSFRYRLVGTRIEYGRDIRLTGTLLDEHPDQVFAEYAIAVCAEAVATRLPVWRDVDLAGRTRRFRHEVLVLPLSADGEHVDTLMSAIAPAS